MMIFLEVRTQCSMYIKKKNFVHKLFSDLDDDFLDCSERKQNKTRNETNNVDVALDKMGEVCPFEIYRLSAQQYTLFVQLSSDSSTKSDYVSSKTKAYDTKIHN